MSEATRSDLLTRGDVLDLLGRATNETPVASLADLVEQLPAVTLGHQPAEPGWSAVVGPEDDELVEVALFTLDDAGRPFVLTDEGQVVPVDSLEHLVTVLPPNMSPDSLVRSALPPRERRKRFLKALAVKVLRRAAKAVV